MFSLLWLKLSVKWWNKAKDEVRNQELHILYTGISIKEEEEEKGALLKSAYWFRESLW
jgi:hypothetical protein